MTGKILYVDYIVLSTTFKIPKGLSESPNRKTDNTMDKRKRTKGQATIYKTIHGKLKIEQHEPP